MKRIMRRLIVGTLTLALVAPAWVSGGIRSEAAVAKKATSGTSKITISPKKASVNIDKTKKITIMVNKKQTKALKIKITSSKKSIVKAPSSVTIKKNKNKASFKVKGLKDGSSKIKATLVMSNGKKKIATSKITVKSDDPQTPALESLVSKDYTVGDVATALTPNATVGDNGVLTYQWYSAEEPSSEGTAIRDATKYTYVPSTATAGTTYYYVVVTNTLNNKTAIATSDRAKITVNEKKAATPVVPTLTNATYDKGATATALNATSTVSDGGTLSYQWYSSTAATGDGTAIASATSPTYTPSTATVGVTYYYAVVTNTLGKSSASATTNRAAITVNAAAAGKPVGVTVTRTDDLSTARGVLHCNATSPDGGTLTYQWYQDNEGRGNFNAIQGATGSTFTPDDHSYDYKVVVTNTLNGTTASAESAVVRIVVIQFRITSAERISYSVPSALKDIGSGCYDLYRLYTAGTTEKIGELPVATKLDSPFTSTSVWKTMGTPDIPGIPITSDTVIPSDHIYCNPVFPQ